MRGSEGENEDKGLSLRFESIPLNDLNILHAMPLKRPPRHVDVLARRLQARHRAPGPDGVRPHERRVADVDANLEHAPGAQGAREEDVALALEVGDHVARARVVLVDPGVVVDDVGGQRRRVPPRVVGHALGDLVVGVQRGHVRLHDCGEGGGDDFEIDVDSGCWCAFSVCE